jgi:predicted transcriptional regulator
MQYVLAVSNNQGEPAMSVLTIRLPDAIHSRLKELARSRGVSTNKLMEELATVALTQQDAQTRFALLASRGDVARGLAALDSLDVAFGTVN